MPTRHWIEHLDGPVQREIQAAAKAALDWRGKVNREVGYGWAQLSQWGTPPKDAYIESRLVKTGLSEAVCSFMLVIRTETNHGYIRCDYIGKDAVTPEILESAGKI